MNNLERHLLFQKSFVNGDEQSKQILIDMYVQEI